LNDVAGTCLAVAERSHVDPPAIEREPGRTGDAALHARQRMRIDPRWVGSVDGALAVGADEEVSCRGGSPLPEARSMAEPGGEFALFAQRPAAEVIGVWFSRLGRRQPLAALGEGFAERLPLRRERLAF